MTQEEFRQRHLENWNRLETMVASRAPRRSKAKIVSAADIVDLSEFDREYRRICKHLALARQRRYGTELVGYLNDLALRANREFYGERRRYLPSFGRFVFGGFPALVRSRAAAVWLSTALFVLPALGVHIALRVDPDLIHTIADAEQIRGFEEMYEPGGEFRTRERSADSDVEMFGFYIFNNIGIAFRTFAGGVVFGVGSIFFVVVNGLLLGAVATHIHGIGYGETFFPFIAGHSAPELIAIVLCGAAGLSLGWSVIAPGRRTRLEALRREASVGVAIAAGAAAMLVLAACIEAFWSPRVSVPAGVRLAVGLLNWVAMLAYLALAGRHDAT